MATSQLLTCVLIPILRLALNPCILSLQFPTSAISHAVIRHINIHASPAPARPALTLLAHTALPPHSAPHLAASEETSSSQVSPGSHLIYWSEKGWAGGEPLKVALSLGSCNGIALK